MKQKRFRWEPQNKYLQSLMRSIVGVVMINFIFQGVFGMSKGEKLFKLLFEAVAFAVCLVSLNKFFDLAWPGNFMLAFLAGHSLNWTLNGQFWVALRYSDRLKFDDQKLKNFIEKIHAEVGGRDYIRAALIIGSFSVRSDHFNNSDIDLRLIQGKGLLDGWKANLYNCYLKMTAFFQKIPLDVYLYEDLAPLKKFKLEEVPLLLKDADDSLKKFYVDRAGYQTFQPLSPGLRTIARGAAA